MKKNILFQCVRSLVPSLFAPQLELIKKHLDEGDIVYIVTCKGDFQYCDMNSTLDKKRCKSCNINFWHNIGLVNFPKDRVIFFPKITQDDYNFLPQSFSNIRELKNFTIDGDFKIGISTASSLISEFREADLDTIANSKKIKDALATSYSIYKFTIELINKLNIDLVYFHNGRHFDTMPVLAASKKTNTKCISSDLPYHFGKYQIFYDTFALDRHYIAKSIKETWENSKKENKLEIGSSWFHNVRFKKLQNQEFMYNKNHVQGSLPQGFDKTKRNISIFNSSLDEIGSLIDYASIYEDEREGIRKILEDFLPEKEFHFYVRIHPNLKGLKNSQIKFFEEISKQFKNLTLIWPDEILDSYELGLNCEKTIVFSSTMGVEMSFWGRPVILTGNAFYESLDCHYKPNSHQDLIGLIRSTLEPKPKLESIKFGFWAEEFGEDFKYFERTSFYEGKFMGINMKTHGKIKNLRRKIKSAIKQFYQNLFL